MVEGSVRRWPSDRVPQYISVAFQCLSIWLSEWISASPPIATQFFSFDFFLPKLESYRMPLEWQLALLAAPYSFDFLFSDGGYEIYQQSAFWSFIALDYLWYSLRWRYQGLFCSISYAMLAFFAVILSFSKIRRHTDRRITPIQAIDLRQIFLSFQIILNFFNIYICASLEINSVP